MTITPEKKDPGNVESLPLSPPPVATRGFLATYKEDQGRHARMAAFWTVVFFVGFGCRFLHDLLVRWPALREPLGGLRIPIVGVDLTAAFLVSMSLFLVGVLLVQRWQQTPKVADLLIDTEAELKKVTWPKGEEVWNASLVVMISVVILGALLALGDVFLARIMRALVLGSP
ncbi:MAG TPA: preprotein translocase subunit SecE [Planctomycetota bacterium]